MVLTTKTSGVSTTLELTPEETQFLFLIVGGITGDWAAVREFTNTIYHKLKVAGVKTPTGMHFKGHVRCPHNEGEE